eukprot:7652398-Pyramimonas_sp.AAC.1
MFSITFEEPQEYIKPDQLEVLKEVYDTCCAPTQREMPPGWKWFEHKKGLSGDTDVKPYCDWLGETG